LAKIKYENNKDPRFQMFPAQRRKITLEKMTANVKDNNANLVFAFSMPLTGQSLIGFPAFIKSSYEDVEGEGSFTNDASLGAFELTGITLEFFRNADNKKKLIGMVGKTLFKFHVVRVKDGDTLVTTLTFRVRMEETKSRLEWWHDMRGVDQWIEFTPTADAVKEADDSQMAFSDDDKDEEGTEDDE
jgi:hypothetical protein